jgi:predicted ATP-binding protein involved in virulence
MNIKSLYLRNYRCFDEFSIDFDPKLTVIAAENGGGKTAILDALTVAFGPFVAGFGEGKMYAFNNDYNGDVLLKNTSHTQILEMERQYPVSLQAVGEIDGREQQWERQLRGQKSRTTVKEAACLKNYANTLQTRVRSGDLVVLPLLAYYGTGRLWKERNLTQNQTTQSSSRTLGYNECLNPTSSYRIFAYWFADLERAEFQYQMERHEKGSPPAISEFAHLLNCVRQAVNICLRPSGWMSLHYRASLKALAVEHVAYGRLQVNQLSDGIRNLLAMVGDIAYRAARLNSHLGAGAALQTPGIVLIDEVDLNLHPRWQQTVLHDLRAAFPELQFIVTSHSPQLLSTVQRENIRLPKIQEKRAVQPVINPYGRESRDALEDIFDVDSRPPREVVAETGLLKDYLQLVERGEYASSQARTLRERLEGVYGAGDINLQMADMVIHKHQARGR